ncbi:hypothetical protein JCM8547_006354 [Rhodosporidiobolus lusitaniae]
MISFPSMKNLAQFNTIVIGAGYTGLTAARDLTLAEFHWQQGFVWRELVRYGLDRRLKITPNEDFPDYADYAINRTVYDGKVYEEKYEPNFKMLDDAFGRLVDFDGAKGVTVNAIPTQVIEGPLVHNDLVNNASSPTSSPWVELSFGAKLADCPFLELVRWYQHCNQSFFFLGSTLWFYKLINEQAYVACCMSNKAFETANLCCSFKHDIQSITSCHSSVKVVTDKGLLKATKVVSMLPQNIANRVKFNLPLSALHHEAFEVGHVNKGNKIVRSITLNGFNLKNLMVLEAAFRDQTLKNGNVAVVPFGTGNTPEAEEVLKHTEDIKKWFEKLHPEIEQHQVGSICKDWNQDTHAQETWCMHRSEH